MQRLIDEKKFPNNPEMAARYNAAYAGLTPGEALILRQMTDAWVKTRQLMLLREELVKTLDTSDAGAERKLDLELAAYAEGVLAHWYILGGLLCTTPEGVAAAMDATAQKMRRVGWIAPTRDCLLDYRTLITLRGKRRSQFHC